MPYFPLQHLVGWQPDSVADLSGLQILVYLRLGKGGVGSKQQPDCCYQVTLHHRIKDFFAISKMAEQKEKVIADALEVAVVGGALLLSVHWTLGTVQVQNHSSV